METVPVVSFGSSSVGGHTTLCFSSAIWSRGYRFVGLLGVQIVQGLEMSHPECGSMTFEGDDIRWFLAFNDRSDMRRGGVSVVAVVFASEC